jgi:hypothetical protein|tara:strand:+ start:743 stop:865 length:123 start_codon:yes stop_codon:yes gene_type:complete
MLTEKDTVEDIVACLSADAKERIPANISLIKQPISYSGGL